jgi:3-carboxy-cis,cis-muconate cycloisomerase
MRQNIDATRGTIYGEKAMMLLATAIGRDKAHHLLDQAARDSLAKKRPLADVLAEMPEVTKHLDRKALQQLTTAADYLGSAEIFRKRLLQSTQTNPKKD